MHSSAGDFAAALKRRKQVKWREFAKCSKVTAPQSKDHDISIVLARLMRLRCASDNAARPPRSAMWASIRSRQRRAHGNHNRSLRLRSTPRYKEVHARICHLTDIEVEVCRPMWKGGEKVCDCPFDDELYARIRRKGIERFEDDDLDGAEHYCRDAERVLAGEHLETGADK
jgi:hypothetical protein